MRSVIDGFEQGENIYCPYCAKEGKKQMFVCWSHGYVYQKWWKGYRKAFPN